jgi:hypothetical protein
MADSAFISNQTDMERKRKNVARVTDKMICLVVLKREEAEVAAEEVGKEK